MLMSRWVWIVWLGGGILGYVAGEMMMTDPVIQRWLGGIADALHYPLPIVLFVGLTALGWWLSRRARSHGTTIEAT